ncbi:MAG: HPP family protein [Patescibacteria group bacterium]
MPTTNFLLFSDTHYSNEYKQQIREKILKDFGITLLSKEQEEKDEMAARKRIVEAASLIRGKVKDGRLLLQHNIEYGFARNLIGGSVIAFPTALIGVVLFYFFSYKVLPFVVLTVSATIYLVLIIFSKKIMDVFGVAYAKVLIQEYTGLI